MSSSVTPLVPPSLANTDPRDYLRLVRAIASSTAIETGQTIQEIESRLLSSDGPFHDLDLAAQQGAA